MFIDLWLARDELAFEDGVGHTPIVGPARPRGRIVLVTNSFEIGPVHVGSSQLFLIAGPCVIESEAHVRHMADSLQRITADLGIPYIFKASYDKANRTSVKSFRGPGLKEGVAILGRLAKDTGLPILTDVHEAAHCEVAAEAADVLQIPAFLMLTARPVFPPD
jgi:2-dehydro-3-deoxyphosphooctonate aldolase (KDO 8-P synthase)